MYPGMNTWSPAPATHQNGASLDHVSSLIDTLGIYPVENRVAIRNQVETTQRQGVNLTVKDDKFVFNSGESMRMLKAIFQMELYLESGRTDLSVAIWLPAKFPRDAPLVYVEPENGMRIASNHANIELSGEFRHEYLETWNIASSLVQLISVMSSIFNLSPPIVAQISSNIPYPMYTRMQPQIPNNVVYPAVSPDPDPPASVPYPSSSPVTAFQQDPVVLQRLLTQKVKERLKKHYEGLQAQMNTAVSNQNYLKNSKQAIQEARESLSSQLSKLSTLKTERLVDIQKLQALKDELQAKHAETTKLEDLVLPADNLSQEGLKIVSQSNAIQDLCYCLDKSLQEGHITLECFLKNIRKYSKEEFFLKVQAKRVQENKKRQRLKA